MAGQYSDHETHTKADATVVRDSTGGITSDGKIVKVLFRLVAPSAIGFGSMWVGAPLNAPALVVGLLSIPAGEIVRISLLIGLEGKWPYRSKNHDDITYNGPSNN
jgi:hypothetical protein